ncbi:MAG: LacI family DNA-binding transcriptional regulator [Lachnospiraceae bacterium]|nr:LacI family DNA-binding transcriptional regulator [Candidatus Merdinaster equi]
MSKVVTMKHIADSLGISVVAVSKALADKEGVSDELRVQIKDRADELGYHYSPSKTKKKGGTKTGNVGVIVANNYVDMTSYSFYLYMYHSLVLTLTQEGYAGIMEIITDEMESKRIMPKIITDRKVEGIIVLGQLKTEYVQKVNESGIPLVMLDFYDEAIKADAVVTDNVYGSYLLTDYCIKQGHEKIAFVGSVNATSSILDRYLGYHRALYTNGIKLREDYLIEDRGKDQLNYIELKLPEDMPTAFVCNCDEIAYLLTNQLRNLGYKVPEDISVTGFDNYTLVAENTLKLTTIAVDVQTMSKEAVALISDQLENGKRSYGIRRVISGKMIVRNSVTPK